MSNGQSANEDRDLLSRLNALKKSSIELDDTNPVLAAHLTADEALDANPAHALFADLSSRFQGLKGAHNRGYTHDALKKDGTPLDIPELQNESNDKTVEDLLAELGPDDQWTLGQDEDIEINALLKDAHGALKDAAPDKGLKEPAKEPHDADADTDTFHLPASTASNKPEPESEPNSAGSSPKEQDLDLDADETLQRLLDEIALDPTPSTIANQADGDHEAGLDPPPPYSAGDDSADDDALARRFASLSVPKTDTDAETEDDGLGLPSVPTGIKTSSSTASARAPPPDDEIDTWCIICLDDAAVKCLGCDGDLYCTKCWTEGHTGEDAGYEERGHRAVQYVKGGGAKKEPKRRRLVGA